MVPGNWPHRQTGGIHSSPGVQEETDAGVTLTGTKDSDLLPDIVYFRHSFLPLCHFLSAHQWPRGTPHGNVAASSLGHGGCRQPKSSEIDVPWLQSGVGLKTDGYEVRKTTFRGGWISTCAKEIRGEKVSWEMMLSTNEMEQVTAKEWSLVCFSYWFTLTCLL